MMHFTILCALACLAAFLSPILSPTALAAGTDGSVPGVGIDGSGELTFTDFNNRSSTLSALLNQLRDMQSIITSQQSVISQLQQQQQQQQQQQTSTSPGGIVGGSLGMTRAAVRSLGKKNLAAKYDLMLLNNSQTPAMAFVDVTSVSNFTAKFLVCSDIMCLSSTTVSLVSLSTNPTSISAKVNSTSGSMAVLIAMSSSNGVFKAVACTSVLCPAPVVRDITASSVTLFYATVNGPVFWATGTLTVCRDQLCVSNSSTTPSWLAYVMRSMWVNPSNGFPLFQSNTGLLLLCQDTVCSTTGRTVDLGLSTCDFVKVEFANATGFPVIQCGFNNGPTLLTRCNDPLCVTTAGGSPTFVEMGYKLWASNTLPVVFKYYSVSPQIGALATCTTPLCTNTTSSALIVIPESVVFTNDLRPVIYAYSGDSFSLIVCSDQACT